MEKVQGKGFGAGGRARGVGLGRRRGFVFREDKRIGAEVSRIIESCPGGYREAAIAVQKAEEFALGTDAGVGGMIVDARDEIACGIVVAADFDADGSLANGGEDGQRRSVESRFGVKEAAGDGVTETVETGPGEDDGVEWNGRKFLEAGWDVATEVYDFQAGAYPMELPAAADAAGADPGAGWQGGERADLGNGVSRVDGHYQEVGRVGTWEDGGYLESGRGNAGEVLEAVYGGVDGAIEEGFLDFLGEETLEAGG